MLEKFIEVKNVGVFSKLTSKGDVALRRSTLLFAENANGKSTICDILRSLSTDKPELIVGRRTVDASGPQEIRLKFSNNSIARFSNGAWTSSNLHIAIYDERFVHDSIYSGNAISHEQRKNLHSVIVGEEGVTLARRIEDANIKLGQQRKAIKETEANLLRATPAGVDIKSFLDLQEEVDVDEKINATEKRISALESADETINEPDPTGLRVPSLPTDLKSTLASTVSTISADVEERIQAHLKKYAPASILRWIEQGRALSDSESCPYCALDLADSPLANDYSQYFSEAYRLHKRKIDALASQTAESFNGFGDSEAHLQSYQTTIDVAASWCKELGHAEPPTPDVRSLALSIKELRNSILDLIESKRASPLDTIVLEDELDEQLRNFSEQCEIVYQFNANAGRLATMVKEHKEGLDVSELAGLRNKLQALQHNKLRFTEKVDEICNQLTKLRNERDECEATASDAKDKLKDYTKSVLLLYHTRINELLKKFGATFQISEPTSTFHGNAPGISFAIEIRSTKVPIMSQSQTDSKPNFRNTLSAGDKSALALAFFIASIEESPNVKDTIVVLDDPFTSLDNSRRTQTQNEITRLGKTCSQIIVLSHSAAFLGMLWGKIANNRKALRLRANPDSVRLMEWDIEQELRSEYFSKFDDLNRFYENGEGAPRDVAMKIRPLLEGYLRFKRPQTFKPSEWLGDYVRLIKCAGPNDSLFKLNHMLPQLDEVNEYSKKYHHDQNPEWDIEPINEAELRRFARDALDLVMN